MTDTGLHVVTIVGTRPEIIRLSRVIARLDRTCRHTLVHTGQNDHPQLSDVFFADLELRAPDHRLAIDTASLGTALGDLFRTTEAVLAAERPDAVLVLGDTNSALSALIAKRMGITVFHMEAGNRCFDENVPEETNRRVIDHFADINLAYTEHARRYLLAEGLHPQRVYVTGSPLREVLDHYRPKIERSTVVADLGLDEKRFILVSMHREENVDSPERLRTLLDSVNAIAADLSLPVVVSTHPRTRKRLDALGDVPVSDAIRFLEPFGYLDYNALQLSARCVVSDSGTIAEESAILGFPAVTIRETTERPEACDTGSLVLAGTEPTGVLTAMRTVLDSWDAGERPEIPSDYAITNTSQRVVNLIVGVTRLRPGWDGIHTRRIDSYPLGPPGA